MARVATDFLAATPQARKALEQAQRLVTTTNAIRKARPELFGTQMNPRWMTDRRLPNGVRSSIVMGEAAGHLVAGLTDEDLRLLVLPKGQIGELPEIGASDVWREIRAGDRMPFPVMWIETPGLHIDLVTSSGAQWPSTGTPEKGMKVLGFMVWDEPDHLRFMLVMLEQDAGNDSSPVHPSVVRGHGHDLNPGCVFVVPRDDTSYEGAYLDGATIVARDLGPGDDGFLMEACPAFWQRPKDGVAEIDPECGGIAAVTEAWMGVLGGIMALLSSVNVEQKPITHNPDIPRDIRRAVKRGAREPDFIYIRQRRVKSESGSTETGRKLTVRHEVRGHFKHYGPDTRIYQAADPKLRRFSPDRGWHVRYWTRPFVRGPEDAPLRIKPRKIGEHAPASDAPLRLNSLEGTVRPTFKIDNPNEEAA